MDAFINEKHKSSSHGLFSKLPKSREALVQQNKPNRRKLNEDPAILGVSKI